LECAFSLGACDSRNRDSIRVSQTVELLQSPPTSRLAATQTHSSLLSISVGALLLPAAYHFALSGVEESSAVEQKKAILKMSHGVSNLLGSNDVLYSSSNRCPLFSSLVSSVSVINIVHSTLDTVYVFYLLFQFWSHQHLYKDTEQKSHKLSVKIPINPRFISERRIFSGETLKTSKSESDSIRWRSPSILGSKMGTLLGVSSGQSSLHSPSEVTLTTSSLDTQVNTEMTTDPHPTIRLVTQALKPHGTDASPESSGLSLPKSRLRSEEDVSTITEETPRNLPESTSTVALMPTGQGSALSTKSFKEPSLSLTLTLLLLTAVTIVSRICFDMQVADTQFSWLHSTQKSLWKAWTG